MIVLLPDGSVRQLHCAHCGHVVSRLSDLRVAMPSFRMTDWRTDTGNTYAVQVFAGHTVRCTFCAISTLARLQSVAVSALP